MSKPLPQRQSVIREQNLIELAKRIAFRWFSRKGLDSLTIEHSASAVQSLAWEYLCRRPDVRDKSLVYWACRKVQQRIAQLRDTGETAEMDEPSYEEHFTALELNDWLANRPEQQKRVGEMLLSGMTLDEVGVALGLCRSRISGLRSELFEAWNAK